MKAVEEALYQTQNRSRQDPLNYPIKLTNKLAGIGSLTGYGDFAPTEQARQVRAELTQAIDRQLRAFERIKAEELPEFNRRVREKAVDAIQLTSEDATGS
mgnify:FL=1